MAITRMAPRSSAMAMAVKKTFKGRGMREPNMVKIPRVKAMSVAMGMPQPCSAGPPALKNK